MERLYAPWRIDYVIGKEKELECVFCTKPAESNDEDNLIVHRSRLCFSIMNKYPYNNGHVLVCPYRHVSDMCDLTTEENVALVNEIVKVIEVLKNTMKPGGFNVGLNLGEVAGAGIEEHLHYHVVPRWFGDTNVMPVLADVRVIPEHLRATRSKLAECFQRMFPDNRQGENE